MEVRREIDDFYELREMCWGQASDILDEIEESGKEDELMSHLDDVFGYDTPTETEVNDYIAYEWETIYEEIGMACHLDIDALVDGIEDDDIDTESLREDLEDGAEECRTQDDFVDMVLSLIDMNASDIMDFIY